MTREEAIGLIKPIMFLMKNPQGEVWSDAYYALEMAIKSLENEEKLLKENRVLKNRCGTLTQGLLCSFCPLECEQRTEDYMGSK